MKKPWFVRLIGWVDLAFWVLLVFTVYTWAEGFHTWQVSLGLWFSGFAAVVLFVVWAVPSALLWGMQRHAIAQAAALAGGAAASAPRAPLRPVAAPRAVPQQTPGLIVPVCDGCKSASILHCCRHEQNFCWPCLARHDSDECTYIKSWRVVPPDARATEERRGRMATSPLSGAR